jgi:hypothetical protein
MKCKSCGATLPTAAGGACSSCGDKGTAAAPPPPPLPSSVHMITPNAQKRKVSAPPIPHPACGLMYDGAGSRVPSPSLVPLSLARWHPNWPLQRAVQGRCRMYRTRCQYQWRSLSEQDLLRTNAKDEQRVEALKNKTSRVSGGGCKP